MNAILNYITSLIVGSSNILFFAFTISLAVLGIFAFVIRFLRGDI